MAIPSRQIGWGTTDNLLWQISKQIQYLTQVTGNAVGQTTTASSEPLTFPITYTSLAIRCDNLIVGNSIYTSETVNDIGELVTLFNNTMEAQLLGTYSASGTDVLVLTTSTAIKNILCPTGELTLYVFSD